MNNEKLYINNKEIELADVTEISKTFQVNDLASLSNRQTNFTKNIKIPKTPKNILTMDFLGVVGNDSNLPYQKNVVNYFVGNDAVIYNGWGVFTQTDEFFNLNIYDGNIDFFKAIENKNLSDVGIQGLNHIKNLDNVLNSFTSTTLNYKYIIADYNGKNEYTTTGATAATTYINIDYQIPSAKVSYLWNRIFDFAGFSYSGSVFSNIDFTNLYMTFPKPVPTNEPSLTPVTSQYSNIVTFYDNVLGFYSYNVILLPNPIASPQMTNTTFNVSGSYRIKCSGSFSIGELNTGYVKWSIYNGTTLKSSGQINGDIYQSVIVSANAGDRLSLMAVTKDTSYSLFSVGTPIIGSILTDIDLVTGYNANFSEALIDFSVKDFVNEIMQRFGLTMFKNKYTNQIDFLTLAEILQGDEHLDWSDKFLTKVSEKYIVDDYAKKSYFKYKYNAENDTHNDGFISISNENLKDSTTVIASKIYSPEYRSGFVSNTSNVYKFWDKEVKDDSTINYKELTGRYYFLRANNYTATYPVRIGSQVMNVSTVISNFTNDSFSRLKFQEIIYNYYSTIESILDKSKLLQVEFYLNSSDIESFDFKKLIYVKQLGSYYLVNKILNWIDGKSTRVELIKVDYMKNFDTGGNGSGSTGNGTYITITNIVTNGCNVVITFATDAVLPHQIKVIGQPNDFGVFPPPFNVDPVYYYEETVYPVSNTISFNVLAGNFWGFYLQLPNENIISNAYYFENNSTCHYVPPAADLTYITITSIETLSIDSNVRTIKVYFNTDMVLPDDLTLNTYDFNNFSLPIFYTGVNTNYVIGNVEYMGNSVLGGTSVISWGVTLQHDSVTSNVIYI
ncbi:hypothetical protein FNW52_12530 [Flavobacterium sp. ZT3R18]|uniref:hypothetical protein n=1 Tax=Flavobacterium sp. ZT3R18 TaxID=2594429 RepID=UPI001179E8AA|nr:hypothetical protein [Flavobacterium sp. ZT3R18]TRX34961.1 hypothetical protein FNW52_12530 [Flavobacterium sp. ZT3R18]